MISARNEFVDYVVELMATWAPVTARKMFGGYGLHRDGLMFGLIDNEQLYLKADSGNETQFEQEGCIPFFYTSNGKAVRMSYWSAPAACLDSPVEMREWCRSAYAAAMRSHAAKSAAPSKKPKLKITS